MAGKKITSERDWLDHYNQTLDYKTPTNSERVKWVLNLYAIDHNPNMTCVDFGCGTGLWCAALHEQTGGRVIGVDFASQRIALARERYPQIDFHPMEIFKFMESVKHSRFLGLDSFDLISFFEVLEHMRDPQFAVHLAKGLLAPGGMLIGSVPLNSHYKTHLHIYRSVEEVESRLQVEVVHVLREKWAFFKHTREV